MNARFNAVSACVLALAAATAATGDTRQIAASAGLDASEAASLSLSEIVAAKINTEARRDDRFAIVARAAPPSSAPAPSWPPKPASVRPKPRR